MLLPAQTSSGSDTSVDPQLLKMALAPHPKLKAALFPPGPRGHGLMADISLYHLLQVAPPTPAVSCDLAASCFQFPVFFPFQCLQPLDSSRLFGWQTANTLNSTGKPQRS